jgi:hypothetical protein
VAGHGIEAEGVGGREGKGFRKINEKTEAAATNLFHKRMNKIISFILLWPAEWRRAAAGIYLSRGVGLVGC